jgi:peptidoglycan/xylan/chitin deacetylase (PgdA/CDA1 family)
MYHSISSSHNPKFQQFAVLPGSFSEQMAYLQTHGYTSLTVTQLACARAEGSTLPEKSVVLTFDDGFADFFTAALPVLQRYRFGATLYVATAYIGKTSSWLSHEKEADRAMLTWEQLKEIAASGIECGGHTHSHPQLDILSTPRAREEIQQCKSILEDHLQQTIDSFAYPYGYQTSSLRQLVQNTGYSSACAVQHRASTEDDDPFALGRLMISANSSLKEFASLLSGQSLSPATATSQLYARVRTPLWQLLRRGKASIAQLQKNG